VDYDAPSRVLGALRVFRESDKIHIKYTCGVTISFPLWIVRIDSRRALSHMTIRGRLCFTLPLRPVPVPPLMVIRIRAFLQEPGRPHQQIRATSLPPPQDQQSQ